MDFFVVGLVSLIASWISFYSGFGFGTILMPIVALFFPLPVAIALTSIVHLIQGGVRAQLLLRYIHWRIFFKFGIVAIVATGIGAWLLGKVTTLPPLTTYTLFSIKAEVSLLHIIIGLLLIFIASNEIIHKKWRLKNLYLAGALSGFFGGFSGTQGAFRSAFLIQLDLEKEPFIATGAAIATVVDIVRLVIYSIAFWPLITKQNVGLLSIATVMALLGIALGMAIIHKVTIRFIKILITVLLYILGILFCAGFVS